MKFLLKFKPKAVKDLKQIPKDQVMKILEKIEKLQFGLQGDIKRLTDFTPEYRLRVGNYRVLFEIEENKIIIYRILHRKDAYK
ncbi:MAG: type II toxin-antitoxin system RelE/ParE family toxin [Candidatus Desulfofervidaceae bacterium]|nr:type II toxin-antitoxin system RelE/ParE family toxin [Candidatus Desulfofervidaceae bacterium]